MRSASDRALIAQFGRLVGDGQAADPEVNQAGALLLAGFEADIAQLDVLVASVEGARSRERVERAAPLLVAFQDAWGCRRCSMGGRLDMPVR